MITMKQVTLMSIGDRIETKSPFAFCDDPMVWEYHGYDSADATHEFAIYFMGVYLGTECLRQNGNKLEVDNG